MEEHRSPRLVTQRHLAVDPVRPAPSAAPASEPESPPAPAPSTSGKAPPVAEPSNRALLERQIKWHRERARFESHRARDEESR